MKKLLLLSLMLVLSISLWSQVSISGNISDEGGEPLIGATIAEKGTTNGTVSDLDGNFSLDVNSSNSILVVSFTGYRTQEFTVGSNTQLNIVMAEGIELGNVQIVGTRSYKRSATETPVAVDIIDVQEVATLNGNVELNRLLQYLAPSFNAQKQSGSDGAEHIDPASLRGLGPDQTLVLINGKRRHQSSLINIFGTRGKGNTGTDFNAIPSSAIERIEILRDGAAAQYGSDAIAGVINIVLRKGTGKLNASITRGGYNPIAPDENGLYDANTPNVSGNFIDLDGDGVTTTSDDPTLDGVSTKIGANYGFDIGNKGGFVNFTTEFIDKGKTLRPGAGFRRGFGEAEITGFSAMLNSAVPISDKAEVYLFGGRNYRDTDAYAFTRNAGDDRAVPSLYPNGFTPRITSIITDHSIAAGVRTKVLNGWNTDISHSFGSNVFHYFIKGTNNATLGDASPTDFDAGGHTFSQNTTNIDFSRYYETNGSILGYNLAFGFEYRSDNFTIFSGEPGSYAAYDVNGLQITQPDQVSTGLAAGSQGFPGYSPANEVDRSRSNVAVYGDAEFDISNTFLLSAALRYENYTDFGSTLNWKLATRLKASDLLSIRGAISTGFRAPSLAQIYYNLRFTAFVDGQLSEALLSANNSPVTKGFGIQPLKEEESFNVSAGFTLNTGGFTATIDGYYIDISDRIVLTGNFDAAFLGIGVETAQFFANAVDTESLGLDVVLTYRKRFENFNLGASLAGNFNKLEVKDVKNGSLDEGTFFGGREVSLLEDAAPKYKFTLGLNGGVGKFNVGWYSTLFGKVSYFSFDNTTPVNYDSKVVNDLVLSYNFVDNFGLTAGIKNLFNVYPTQQIASDNTDSGGYFDAVQMGFGGTYYYMQLRFAF